ncbi:hypothetical protein HII31_06313 [Pseudocercospora fuligena]|uniref:Uncharacterized protein n=1 Tax=Pseudocercospora fuligena TaxID=685502 RepID=A0A8H6RJP1_9PEZI|nr:hypothetical protein HII31_06313 [Pseudocercospora fuligena]
MSSNGADSGEFPPNPTADQRSDIEDKLEAPGKESAADKLTLEKARFFANAADALPAFNDRLGGGGFGDLLIKGSKTTVSNGHAELFEIIRLLEKIQEDQTRVINIEEKKSKAEELIQTTGQGTNGATSKPSKMNSNMMAAVRALIKRETDDQFRDLRIENENLKKERLEDKKQIQQLGNKVEALESKIRKSASSNQGGKSSQHQDVTSRWPDLEEEQGKTRDLHRFQSEPQDQPDQPEIEETDDRDQKFVLELKQYMDYMMSTSIDIGKLQGKYQSLKLEGVRVQEDAKAYKSTLNDPGANLSSDELYRMTIQILRRIQQFNEHSKELDIEEAELQVKLEQGYQRSGSSN